MFWNHRFSVRYFRSPHIWLFISLHLQLNLYNISTSVKEFQDIVCTLYPKLNLVLLLFTNLWALNLFEKKCMRSVQSFLEIPDNIFIPTKIATDHNLKLISQAEKLLMIFLRDGCKSEFLIDDIVYETIFLILMSEKFGAIFIRNFTQSLMGWWIIGIILKVSICMY